MAVTQDIEATRADEDVPSTPPASALPTYEEARLSSPEPQYEEPLYTEINIPLPPLPKPKAHAAPTGKRPKSHSISSFRPFHRRGSSSESTRKSGDEWPRIKKEVKSREVAAAMNLVGRHHRSGTVDALAVVPAVLVLSAELFTPGIEKSKSGKWEEGMI
ncbi:uncharacterized protein CC84DRAFT_42433 [Paraphaeosphaeria sporulosa]|uniref:Uncharacterized protein n=1 Tax=Paraphaeosphaeria sporulosa TaxID=1460663 RepID=A0A177CWV9_9PLEO|nr:uncharacterized protein CC84DRAFT_42433 [Paraphaeosphaeria sporulosa]OAG11691.1 hypothetical protein CC84DRAFT_42433 [Paraphaeosphaeria sporulosa]